MLLPIVLLAALGFAFDMDEALGAIARADLAWLLAGLALVQLQVVGSALRWRWTAARLGQRIGTRRAIAEYYLGTFANQVLPGGVTGDAARAVRNVEGVTLPVAGLAVAVERLSGQAALFAITAAGLACWPWLWPAASGDRPASASWTLGAVATTVGLAALALAALRRHGSPALRGKAEALRRALRRAWLEDGAWRVQGATSLGIVGSYLGLYATSAAALGTPLPFAALVTVVPLALLTMLLPIAVGGWGLREAAAVGLWPLVGLAATDGLATSVLYGLTALVGSLPGLAVALAGSRR